MAASHVASQSMRSTRGCLRTLTPQACSERTQRLSPLANTRPRRSTRYRPSQSVTEAQALDGHPGAQHHSGRSRSSGLPPSRS